MSLRDIYMIEHLSFLISVLLRSGNNLGIGDAYPVSHPVSIDDVLSTRLDDN